MPLTSAPHRFEDRIFTVKEIDAVFEFESQRLELTIADEVERQMAVWSTSWRREFLEHYAASGWSFVLIETATEKCAGVVLGQMLTFYQGHPQVLWIEHLSGTRETEAHRLLDIAYRWARDKHLQGLVIRDQVRDKYPEFWTHWPRARLLGAEIFIPTTRSSE